MPRRRRFLPAIAFLALGCGGGPSVVAVSGTVTLDGQPLAAAAVSFYPVSKPGDPNPGPSSRGRTDAQGRFTLETIASPSRSGAMVGTHRVEVERVTTIGASDTERGKAATPAGLPARYNRATELTFDVPAGGTAAANFALTSK